MKFEANRITDKALKEKMAIEFSDGDYSKDFINELIESEFWAITDENKRCWGLSTMEKNNETSASISHYIINEQLLETDVAILLYIMIEKYCVNNKFEQMTVRIPNEISGVSVPMRKFFKKVGFNHRYQEMSHEGKFTLMIKNNLRKWYVEDNGELIPRTNNRQ
jgi:hypothetical protein